MDKIVDISIPRKTLRQKLRYHCDAVMKKLLTKEEPQRKPMATRKVVPINGGLNLNTFSPCGRQVLPQDDGPSAA